MYNNEDYMLFIVSAILSHVQVNLWYSDFRFSFKDLFAGRLTYWVMFKWSYDTQIFVSVSKTCSLEDWHFGTTHYTVQTLDLSRQKNKSHPLWADFSLCKCLFEDDMLWDVLRHNKTMFNHMKYSPSMGFYLITISNFTKQYLINRVW